MKKFVRLLGCTTLLLAACEEFDGGSSGASSQFIELPEGVLAIAAPYQDLKAVRIDPTSGCYIYRHAGPVETTFLPLRSREGRPICSQQSEGTPVS